MFGNLRTISTPKDPLALFRCQKKTAEVKKPGVRLFHLLLPLPSCTNLIYRGYFALRGFFSMATLQTTTTHKVLEEMVVQHTQLHDNFLSGGLLKTCHGLPALLTTWTLFFQKFPTPFSTTFELLWNSINFFNVGALTTELKKNQCNLTKAFIEVNSNWSLLPRKCQLQHLVLFASVGWTSWETSELDGLSSREWLPIPPNGKKKNHLPKWRLVRDMLVPSTWMVPLEVSN